MADFVSLSEWTGLIMADLSKNKGMRLVRIPFAAVNFLHDPFRSHFPTLAVSPSNKLIGLRQVGDLHVCSIP